MSTDLLLKLAKSINAALADPGVERRRRHARHGHARGDRVFPELDRALRQARRGGRRDAAVHGHQPRRPVQSLQRRARRGAAPSAQGYGVMILLNDTINAARDTTKNNTYRVDTFVARDVGPLGFADSDRITFYRRPLYRHTAAVGVRRRRARRRCRAST